MNIFLCYCYEPTTTAVYFARGFGSSNNVIEITSPYLSRKGYSPTTDLTELIRNGLPQPDLALWIDSSGDFFPCGWENLACPTAAYLIDVHTNIGVRDALAPFFDYIFVAQRDYLSHYRQLGYLGAVWLPLACDPGIHSKTDQQKVWQIGFVGKTGKGDRARRLKMLSNRYTMNDYQRTYPIERIGEIYAKSEIVFNCSIGGDLNMRVFEALASGSMLVTDRIKNGQSELFEDRFHLVEYIDDDDLLKQIEYYLQNDQERNRIGRDGKHLVLSEHTYNHRCEEILKTIFVENNATLSAKARSFNQKKLRQAYQNFYQRKYMVSAILDNLQIARSSHEGAISTLAQSIQVFARRLSQIFRSY